MGAGGKAVAVAKSARRTDRTHATVWSGMGAARGDCLVDIRGAEGGGGGGLLWRVCDAHHDDSFRLGVLHKPLQAVHKVCAW